jgi:hypothetical protein
MKPPEELDQTANKPNPSRFVEELADEHDYWMSLTDAARITRTSEPMVRRWVTTGRLPVRKEPAGINQRTRLVRASDVALIRPIIDPTAAITDDIHKLDLLSIPRQQEQIIKEHQHSLQLIQQMRQDLEAHVQQTHTSFEQAATHLQQQGQEWNRRLAAQQTEWQQALLQQQKWHAEAALRADHQIQALLQQTTELENQGTQQQQALAHITDAHTTLQQALQKLGQDVHHQMDHLSHDFTTRLRLQEQQFQNRCAAMEKTLASYDQAHTQMQQRMAAIQQNFLTLQETLLASIERQRSEIDGVLELRWSDLQHERTAQYEYMKKLEERQASLEIQDQARQNAWLANQEREKDREQQIQLLTAMLHEEKSARQLLAEQFSQQHEQLQVLHRQSEARRPSTEQ